MLVFRSVSLGLFAACLFVVATRTPVTVIQPHTIEHRFVTSGRSEVQVIDIAAGVAATDVPNLVHLLPGERVAEVNQRVVADEHEAWRAIAIGASNSAYYYSTAYPGRFVDLLVEGGTGGRRRVLLLLH